MNWFIILVAVALIGWAISKRRVTKAKWQVWVFLLAGMVGFGALANLDSKVTPTTTTTSQSKQTTATSKPAPKHQALTKPVAVTSNPQITSQSKQTTATSKPAPKHQALTKPVSYKIGDTVRFSDWDFRVTAVKTANHVGDPDSGYTSKGQYLVVSLSAAYHGGNEYVAENLFDDLKLVTTNGTTYSIIDTGSLDESYWGNGLVQFNTGDTQSGFVVFDVPPNVAANVANLSLQIQGYFDGDGWSYAKRKVRL